MRKNLLLTLLTPFWLACNTSDESEFGIQPALESYNDEAPALRKSYCFDSDCKEMSSEDKYIYDGTGKLTRLENIGRTANGTMTVYQYSEYTYESSGSLAFKEDYVKNASQTEWVLFNKTEYEYEAGLLKTEKLYNYANSGNKTLLRSTVHEFTNGTKTGQAWYDAHGKMSYSVKYGYKNGVLNFETWYDASGKANRTFEHKFAGNRRQIGEYLIGSRELLAMIEKTYDDKGRLLTQETKVNNPLLCALPPGKIQFTY